MTIDVWAWGNLIGGLVLLSFAADWLVDGAGLHHHGGPRLL